jgi:hypothetical protein
MRDPRESVLALPTPNSERSELRIESSSPQHSLRPFFGNLLDD